MYYTFVTHFLINNNVIQTGADAVFSLKSTFEYSIYVRLFLLCVTRGRKIRDLLNFRRPGFPTWFGTIQFANTVVFCLAPIQDTRLPK